MTRSVGILLTTAAASIIIGLFVGAYLVGLLDASWLERLRGTPGGTQALIDAIFIAVVAPLPLSLPLGLAGGAIAVFLERRWAPPTRRWHWIYRAVLAGSVLGSAGVPVLYLVTAALGPMPNAVRSILEILPRAAVLGGLCGATCGGVVAVVWAAVPRRREATSTTEP